MRLLLHIGTEKTGSTALQEYLESRRRTLAEAGFLLPDFLEGSNHLELACMFMADRKDDEFLSSKGFSTPEARARRREELLSALADQVKANRKSASTMLISSEHFQSRLTDPKEVDQFIRSIAPIFCEVKVVCYLRRQERMALSFYTQKLRGGYVPPNILPVRSVRHTRPNPPIFFDYESLLDRWAGAVGEENVLPVVYERSSLASGDVIVDFFQRIGCEFPGHTDSLSLNTSYDAAGQLAMLAFNRLNFHRREEATEVRMKLDRFLQEQADGRPLLPPSSEAREFNEAFTESNRRVAERWFNRKELFQESGLEYPAEGTSPDWEKATTLLAKFLSHPDYSANYSPDHTETNSSA
ncbi:MAG: hypothetical protein AAGI88_17075 [Pseudomonadota bacterium]